jgi:hypothetical protein
LPGLFCPPVVYIDKEKGDDYSDYFCCEQIGSIRKYSRKYF